MNSRHLCKALLFVLVATTSAAAAPANPVVTGAFGINLGDRLEVVLAAGFHPFEDTAMRAGVYGRADHSVYLPYQTLYVAPKSQVVYQILAWRPIEETQAESLTGCTQALYELLAKLRAKYPMLHESGRLPNDKSFYRALSERVEKTEYMDLAEGRHITLECGPDPDPAKARGSRLSVWYVMDDKESKAYRAEAANRIQQVRDQALKSQGFDAKDF